MIDNELHGLSLKEQATFLWALCRYSSNPETCPIILMRDNDGEYHEYRDDKEQVNTAAHIAASDPATVMADINEILCLRAEVERLEKEADWLALVLANVGCGIPLTEYLGEDVNGMSPPTPEHWREAARKVIENK